MTLTKTNLRINNDFIIKNEKNNKYYLTNISKLKVWKKMKTSKLEEYCLNDKNDITHKINKLFKKFDVKANVNFIVDFDLHNKDPETKKISISGGSTKSL